MSASELYELIQPTDAGATLLPLTDLLVQRQRDRQERVRDGDLRAWNNSIPVVVDALVELGLGEVQVLIEFDLPHTGCAVDLVLCGLHPTTGDRSYVAVELKQVSHATVHPDCPIAVDLGYHDRKKNGRYATAYKVHPVRQVQRYCEYMTRYLDPVSGEQDRLLGAALLHNAKDEHVAALLDLPETGHGALYTLDDLPAFKDLLTVRLAAASGHGPAEELVHAQAKPLEPITSLSRHRSRSDGGLTLLDDQEIGFYRVMRRVDRATGPVFPGLTPAEAKQVFVFRGGPGSGKSAIALELQRVLRQRARNAVLVSGSRSYTQTLQSLAVQEGWTKAAAARLYRYFSSFTRAAGDSVDVLICDEAHRLRRISANFRTPKAVRDAAPPQVEELIRAARVPVFLLDDHQSIRPDEVGTAEYIKQQAERLGHEVVVLDLAGIFRQGGSTRYREWVRRLLGWDGTDPTAWQTDGRTQLAVADDPKEMEHFIKARHLEGYSARITAGYCWPWNKPADGRLVRDVQIGTWRLPWNVKPEHSVESAPSSSLWATDPRGIDQIGCVYTAQTFEYDWNAVVIGPDLVWRGNRFVVDRTASKDPVFNRSVPDEVVERCIRNSYYVLLTRGVVGTLLYSPDEETQQALHRLVPGMARGVYRANSRHLLDVALEGNPVPVTARQSRDGTAAALRSGARKRSGTTDG
jgi:DUF2075 family protein